MTILRQMHYSIRRRLVWAGLLVPALFAISFVATGYLRSDGRAGALPGAVSQAGEAASNGVTIRLERATFSATAVDVDLFIESRTGSTIGGVAPGGATLSGQAPLNQRVEPDGRVILRFPGAAWEDGPSLLPLSVTSIQVRGQAGRFDSLPGRWDLSVRVPVGEAAEAARFVTALEPAVMRIADQEVAVAAFRTNSAIIIRYSLPARVNSFAPPKLKAGDRMLEAAQLQQSPNGEMEAWFELPPAETSLALVFEKLALRDISRDPWSLDVTLAPFELPSDPGRIPQHDMGWAQSAASGGPAVVAVTWENRPTQPRLNITVSGLWDPAVAGLPEVTADGTALKVAGVVLMPATRDREASTRISFVLAGKGVPREITVRGSGETIELPPVEVALKR
jgi:hypothetical protein